MQHIIFRSNISNSSRAFPSVFDLLHIYIALPLLPPTPTRYRSDGAWSFGFLTACVLDGLVV